MTHNPITQEIREIRHQLAAQQGNDVHRIGEELRRRLHWRRCRPLGLVGAFPRPGDIKGR